MASMLATQSEEIELTFYFRRDVLNPTQFDLLEAMYGFNENPCSLPLHPRIKLGVVSSLMYDWAHVLICDGTVDKELGQLGAAFQASRTASSLAEMGAYIARWTWPKQMPEVQHLFHRSRNKSNVKSATFQCSASEFLTIYPVVTRYLQRVVLERNELPEHVASMLAALDVLDLCHNVRRGIVTGPELINASERHFALFRAAYGEDLVRPKHHYEGHLGEHLAFFGALWSCLTNERRHRVVKRYSINRKILKQWELGVLEDVTTHQIWELQEGFLQHKRVHQVVPKKQTLNALMEMFPDVPGDSLLIANVAGSTDGEVTVGDVVAYGHPLLVGELVLLFFVDVHAYAIVEAWDRTGVDGAWVSYTIKHDVNVIPQQELRVSLLYSKSADGASATIFLPRSHR